MKVEDLAEVAFIHEGASYRRSSGGRWYYLHEKLGWCPVFGKVLIAELDELLKEHA